LRKNDVPANLLPEKTNNFLKLALDFVFFILKSFGCIVGVVKFNLENIGTLMNPRRVINAKLVAYTVDKHLILTSASVVLSLIIRTRGCSRVAGLGSSALRCSALTCITVLIAFIVIGYVSKFATKGLVFLAECIPPSLMLSSNLQNALTWLGVELWKIIKLTLMSASLLAERLRGRVFSSSEGGSWEGLVL
jgi:hypothetical protein